MEHSRRDIIAAAFAALSFTCGLNLTAKAAYRSRTGCCIAPMDFGLLATSLNDPPSQFDIETSPIIGSSGRGDDFDFALGEVLAMLAGFFNIRPGFGFYDDSSGYNALAAQVNRVPKTQNTVVFGLGLLNKFLDRQHGEFAIVAVCAHEFAHILQYETGEYTRVKNSLPSEYCVELHADFLAGFFMGAFEKARPATRLWGVGNAWRELGSSDFNKPGTHGTSEQRIRAIEGGYFYFQDTNDLRQALNAAFNHVRSEA